jgi:SOS response regulatory protein OraA/RecX
MTTTDGERIAPVTYLFRSRPDEAGSDDELRSPAVGHESVAAHAVAPRTPTFVDLGEPETDAETDAEPALEPEPEPEKRARKGSFAPINNVSMNALARRGMSSREMREYLIGREFETGAVEDEVERLESVALLDDVALGETLVRTLRDRKGYGRSALTGELRRRKLDALAIELALDGLDDDELERATEIAHKRASQLRSYDAETAKRRLSAFLMRKGYSGSVVSTAVQRALAPSGPVFR